MPVNDEDSDDDSDEEDFDKRSHLQLLITDEKSVTKGDSAKIC